MKTWSLAFAEILIFAFRYFIMIFVEVIVPYPDEQSFTNNAFRLVIANYLHRVYYIVRMERMDLETIFADTRPLI